jgi:hypothetical protein
MAREYEGWRRYAAWVGGMVLCAALCLLAVPFLTSPTGTIGPTTLQAESPAAAVAATMLAFAVAAGVACAVGRLVNAAVGLFVLGAGLWALRYRCATVVDVAFAGGSLGLAAIETALWGFAVLGAAFAVFRWGGPLRDVPGGEPAGAPSHMRLGLRGLAAGLLVLPVVWLFARSPLRGQTLAAAVMGGIAVGLAGRLLEPRVQPRLLFAVPCFIGALAQAACALALRVSPADAFITQTLPALALPMPIDWAAGSLMGVAIGLGWAKSFLHDPAPSPAATIAPRGQAP